MAQDIGSMLSDAKQAVTHSTETEALNKVSPTPVPEGLKSPEYKSPSYTAARQERKAPSMADEMKAKSDMVQKAKTALNN